MSDKERNNLVYDHCIVPVKLHYYGYTGNGIDTRKRGGYQRTALQYYIDQYGWDNISTTIVTEGLTKKEAELLEDKLIKEGWKRGDCINKQGSGGDFRDNPKKYYQDNKEEIKVRYKQYYQDHKEEKHKYYQDHKEEKHIYDKKLYDTPEGRIYHRVKSFNRRHPDKAIETPMEARQKYIETGYIPSYIKNDDLI